MDPQLILYFLAAYLAVLLIISYFTSRGSTDETFFNANHKSRWYIVAFGMVGTSMSGVSLISVTGKVSTDHFAYLQVVLGYLAGYIIIALVLLPLYYRLKLTSIYNYLGIRYGSHSRMTGSFYFMLSRTLGAAARLFLVVVVMDKLVFDHYHISFEWTVAIVLLSIFLYTFQSGIKTIIWTDTIQTALLLAAIGLSIYSLKTLIGQSTGEILSTIHTQNLDEVFTKGWGGFFSSFVSGMLICITMTGLDQGMMQRSLSCPSLKDAQKNIYSFAVVMLLVNVLFLFIGAMLKVYMVQSGTVLAKTDLLFPEIATTMFGTIAAGVFVMGMVAATFSSADDAMAALTTSFCLDILKIDETKPCSGFVRKCVHMGFAVLMFLIIVLLFKGSDKAVIDMVLSIGSVTYGPLLGLFAFGLFSKKRVADRLIPWIAIAAPIIILFFAAYAGYLKVLQEDPSIGLVLSDLLYPKFLWTLAFSAVGNEIILYIAGLVVMLLYLFSEPVPHKETNSEQLVQEGLE